MTEKFERHENLFCIMMIVIYVIVNSFCMQNFGTESLPSAVINTVFSVLLIVLAKALKRVKFYGLTGITGARKYLYFIPLIAIASVNLWNGCNVNNTAGEIVFHFITMINVGFIEELLFRGFLFKMMEKDSRKSAVIVSSLTFGIGHIVNLLNGAEVVPTIMQMCYAFAIGYVFVIIFIKSKSIMPCIITHAAVNSLSIFNVENKMSLYIVPVFLIAVSVGYAVYLNKRIRE